MQCLSLRREKDRSSERSILCWILHGVGDWRGLVHWGVAGSVQEGGRAGTSGWPHQIYLLVLCPEGTSQQLRLAHNNKQAVSAPTESGLANYSNNGTDLGRLTTGSYLRHFIATLVEILFGHFWSFQTRQSRKTVPAAVGCSQSAAMPVWESIRFVLFHHHTEIWNIQVQQATFSFSIFVLASSLSILRNACNQLFSYSWEFIDFGESKNIFFATAQLFLLHFRLMVLIKFRAKYVSGPEHDRNIFRRRAVILKFQDHTTTK